MNIWVNGCFDILHGGHLDLLEYAKNLDNLENYLVVGIDSDERVKLLKGSGRPINHESFRKRILESLEFVDEVVIFGSEKELETIIKRHDIDYALSTDVAGIRKADLRMVKNMQRIKKDKTDSRFNIAQGERLIQAKVKLEDLGVNPLRFASFGGVEPQDKPLLLAEKKKLEIEGFGFGVEKKKKSSKRLPPGLKLKRSLLKQTHKKKYNKNEVDAAVANIMKALQI